MDLMMMVQVQLVTKYNYYWLLKIQSKVVGQTNHGSKCGGLLNIQTEVSGQISFWNPDGYDVNLNCEWYLKVPEGSLISISFTDFNLESPDAYQVCSNDYVLLKNDINDNVEDVKNLPIVTKLCGTSIPDDLLLQGNQILLLFHSNHLNSFRGFRMSYDIIQEGFQIW